MNNKISLKRKLKLKFELFNLCVSLLYLILCTLKYFFTRKIINKEFYKEKGLWFYNFDTALIYFNSFGLICNLFFIFIFSCVYELTKLDDKKSIILSQINGFNINDFKLPLEFEKLKRMNKIWMIFKKENMKKYSVNLDNVQSMLIDKINFLRNLNNINKLKYSKVQQLPDYIINKKTELIFKEEENIYKFSNNYYLIKYPTSECQKDIRDKNIINIITIDFLDKINIIRKYNYEYITLYNSQFNENYNKNIRRRINEKNTINIKNTEDRLNESEQSVNLVEEDISNNDYSTDKSDIIII